MADPIDMSNPGVIAAIEEARTQERRKLHADIERDRARIRELERNASRRTPIVALTAGVTPEERAKCLAAGMDDFVAKPIVVAALAASLGRWTAPTQAEAASAGR